MTDWPFKTIDRQLVHQVFDDYHEGLFILDREAKIVYYNKHMAQMDGYAPVEVNGRLFVDIYNLNEHNSVSLACLANQVPVKKPLYYRTRLGTLVNAYCNSYPVFEDGQLAGALCFTLDYNQASAALDDLTRTYMALPEGQKPAEPPREAPHTFAHLIGRSASFAAAVEKAQVAAQHNLPIMLVGETGSGKELFAQSIHNRRPGRRQRFLAVNCAAIPENLLESLLFGTAKGAFTGALDKAGVFEAAAGGSIFLDEINSMSMDLQAKLLRVIQEKRVARVGSTREFEVDCQIISATSANPYSDMSSHRLRQDLFYRLGAILIHIPPLRDRLEDIEVLAEHFIKKHRINLKSRAQGLAPETLAWLQRKIWPGNVRELEHAVVSAMLFAPGETLLKTENFDTLDNLLSPRLRREPPLRPLSVAPPPRVEAGEEELEMPVSHWEAKQQQREEEKERLAAALDKTGGHKAAAAALLGISPQLLNSKLKKYGLGRNPAPEKDQDEERVIIKALERTGGHKSAAAAILGLSRQLLYSKMKKYGLTVNGGRVGRKGEAPAAD